MVMSAVSSVRTFGVLVTVMPRAWAAITSILSTPLPKLAISRSLHSGSLRSCFGDFVGDGGHQHIGGPYRLGDLFLTHRRVVEIEPGVEQLAHPGLDRVRQLARDNNERFSLSRHFLLSRVCCSPFPRFVKCLAVEASLTRLFDTAAGRVVPVFGYGLLIVFLGFPDISRWFPTGNSGVRPGSERSVLSSRRPGQDKNPGRPPGNESGAIGSRGRSGGVQGFGIPGVSARRI